MFFKWITRWMKRAPKAGKAKVSLKRWKDVQLMVEALEERLVPVIITGGNSGPGGFDVAPTALATFPPTENTAGQPTLLYWLQSTQGINGGNNPAVNTPVTTWADSSGFYSTPPTFTETGFGTVSPTAGGNTTDTGTFNGGAFTSGVPAVDFTANGNGSAN